MRYLSTFLFIALVSVLNGAEFVWVGAGDGKTWDAAANWRPANGVPASTDVAVLKTAGSESVITLGGDTPLRGLVFDPGALHACRLVGGSFSLGEGSSVTFKKLPGDVGMGKSASQNIASELRLSGAVQFANLNRHYLGGEKLLVSGPMVGAGRFLVGGVRGGIVQLSGDNTKYRGQFVIDTGSLMLSHSAALGSGDDPVLMNGGAIVIGARVSTTHDFEVAKDAAWDSHGPNGTHDGTIRIVQGATLTVKNGGGNTMTWRGVIEGAGDLAFAAHGTTFAGERANTLTGTFIVGGTRGATILARADGVPVVAGPLTMSDQGTLRWAANDQIADSSPVTFAGTLPTLDLAGHRESVGRLDLQGDGQIALGGEGARLHFADSSQTKWHPDKVLLVLNGAEGDKAGIVQIGQSDSALTQAQLARIGFVDPVGFPAGTYTAELNADGALRPTGKLVVPVDLPLDLSAKEVARRTTLFDVEGLAKLTGTGSPLTKRPGSVLSFYGDSITWGGGFLRILQKALATGEGTNGLGTKLINHGVNGGGVLALRDGDEGTSHFGKTKPLPFAQTIAADKPDVVVITIGVNDVWWRKTAPEVFEQALRDLVKQAEENGATPVLATLAILKEKVGARDPRCDAFADITRKVAKDTSTTLVDLRAAFMACIENESVTVRPGGAWTSDPNCLTHDGVHPNARGEQLLAEMIAQGIAAALSGQR